MIVKNINYPVIIEQNHKIFHNTTEYDSKALTKHKKSIDRTIDSPFTLKRHPVNIIPEYAFPRFAKSLIHSIQHFLIGTKMRDIINKLNKSDLL